MGISLYGAKVASNQRDADTAKCPTTYYTVQTELIKGRKMRLQVGHPWSKNMFHRTDFESKWTGFGYRWSGFNGPNQLSNRLANRPLAVSPISSTSPRATPLVFGRTMGLIHIR